MSSSGHSVQIENDHLRITVDGSGQFTLFGKTTGIAFTPFSDSQGALIRLIDGDGQPIDADLHADCAVDVTASGDRQITIRHHSLKVGGRTLPDFALTVTLDLSAGEAAADVIIQSLELDAGMALDFLAYPHHQLALQTAREDGYLVVPSNQGVIIPSQFETGFMRFQHNTWFKIADQEHTLLFNSGRLNMPWFGAVKRSNGQQLALLAHVETSADAALKVICNKVVPTPRLARPDDEPSHGKRLSTLTPIWRGSLGKLGYARRLRLELIPGGSYVDLAKRYREKVIAGGRFTSLKQKIAENPLMERLIGAPDIKIYIYTNRLDEPYYRAGSQPVLTGYERVHTTFVQVAEMVEDMHSNLQLDRALILLGGWIRAGYDRQHPDVWPPAEKAGGVEGLRQASKAATSKGYLFALHDNYQDMYPDAPRYHPKYIMRNRDGSLMRGHVWDGGPCYLIDSAQAIELATPVLDAVQANTSANGYYLDTTTAAPLYESFGQERPLTRSQDRTEKLALLQWLQWRGFIVGAEAGTDWAIGACGFFEGLPGSAVGYYDGITGGLFGISAPLFSLVYHDAVVMYWQHGQPFGREDHQNHVLHDLLSANPSSWSLVYDQWNDLKPLIQEASELLGQLHRRTAHHPMTTHRFLSEDYAVQETQFADGTTVLVNFGITSAQVDGQTIAPKGFVVKDPQQGIVTGSFSRHIQMSAPAPVAASPA